MPFLHEEEKEISSFWSWMIVVLFCVVIVAWGIFNCLMIPDPPRRWDMGVLHDVPGQSIYSTAGHVVGEPAPAQVAPLPEVIPMEGRMIP